MKLHLGCSDDLKPGWLNVDVYDGTAVMHMAGTGIDYQQADLNQPWPWVDGTVDAILAHDVFEHLSNLRSVDVRERASWWQANPGVRYLLQSGTRWLIEVPGPIWALNEAWRVLKPGGILDFRVPAAFLKDGSGNPGAQCDPTHRSVWHEDVRYYFCEEWNHPRGERGRLGANMGIVSLFRPNAFKTIEYGEGREKRSKLVAILEAVK